MSVFEKIQNFMMRFAPQVSLEDYTYEQLKELERQGFDVTEYLAVYERGEHKSQLAEKAIDEKFEVIDQLRFTMDRVSRDQIHNPTELSKLDTQHNQLRSPMSQIIQDTLSKRSIRKNEDKIRTADLIYTSVVQSDGRLWLEVTEDLTPAVILLVYSLNPKYYRDVPTLKNYPNTSASLEIIML